MRFARSRQTVVTCMADGSSLWRHTTTTTLGTRCRSAGAVHPINSTFRREAALLQALRSGTITFEQACDRYALSIEELRAWERDFERHGLYGLRATRVQLHRD